MQFSFLDEGVIWQGWEVDALLRLVDIAIVHRPVASIEATEADLRALRRKIIALRYTEINERKGLT